MARRKPTPSQEPKAAPEPPQGPKSGRVRDIALGRFSEKDEEHLLGIPIPEPPRPTAFAMPQLPAAVFPSKKAKLALDSSAEAALQFLNGNQYNIRNTFLGYPFLSELMQIAEFRNASVVPAGQMVKKWVKFASASKSDKSDRIKTIEASLRKHRIKSKLYEAAVYDGCYGGCRAFIDLGEKDPKNLRLPLVDDAMTIAKGSFRGIKVIDPTITSPSTYNAVDPLADDYYVPQTWFLLGREVHHSRLLHFVSKPLPLYLRPVYNFGGISTSQLAFDTIVNWREVRNSTTKLIKSYSINGIYTDLSEILNGGGGDKEKKRADLFVKGRDNRGLLLLDKGREEYFQHNVPLGSLDKLQAQAQEHPAAITRIPLIFLLGITPTGLNASSEGEIRAFYDYISELQEILFRDNLERIVAIIQLSEFGDVDPDIVFEFNPLWQMDDRALASIRKDDAVAAQTYYDMGAVTAEQVTRRLADDPHSGWDGLDVGSTVIAELDPDEEDGGDPNGGASPGAPKPLPGLPAAPGTPGKAAGPLPEPGAKVLVNGGKK